MLKLQYQIFIQYNEIIHLLRYPVLSKERAKLAQKQALSMTWNKAADKTISIYQSLL